MLTGPRVDHRRQAVLVFVDEQPPAVTASRSLPALLRRHWRLTVSFALLAAIGALYYCAVTPKWYRAQTLLALVKQESADSSLGAVSGQLGGLANLVGLDLGSKEDLKKETLARFSSRQFTYDFLQDEDLMPILFAAKWDAAAKRWRSVDPSKQPTLEQGYRYFIANVCTVSEDRRSGLVKITVDWKDRRLASEWANKLVARINGDRRAVARVEAERNLEYLNRELERTSIIEVRQAINRLIEAEIRKMMLANVREQYVFRVIDPAFVPGREGIIWPRLAILTAVALLLGGTVGFGVAATVARLRHHAEGDTEPQSQRPRET